jgi:hypothetical protein
MPQINFRLTEEEKEILKDSANKSSMTITDFCKQLALGCKIKSTISAQVKDELIAFWRELQANDIDSILLDKLEKIILKIK